MNYQVNLPEVNREAVGGLAPLNRLIVELAHSPLISFSTTLVRKESREETFASRECRFDYRRCAFLDDLRLST
jgi:hypothetical protein